MVTIKNLEIYEGDSDSMTVIIGSGSTDITNYTLYFTVKSDKADSDASALIAKQITSHTNPTIGETQIPILDTDTKGLTAGTHFYDIRCNDGSGAISTLLRGNFKIVECVGDLD